MGYIMKNSFFHIIVVVLLLAFCGCSLNTEEPPQLTEQPSDIPVTFPAPVPEDKITYSEDNYKNETFLAPKYISIFDDMLYYSISIPDYPYAGKRGGSQLRKCNFDLSQEDGLFTVTRFPRFTLNPDGRLIIREMTDNEFYIYDVHDNVLEKGILQNSKVSYDDAVLYKDKIILNLYERGSDMPRRLNIYDTKENLEETVSTGSIINIGVIDDAIYFWSLQDSGTDIPPSVQAIMRYDMKSKTTEKVFEVDM